MGTGMEGGGIDKLVIGLPRDDRVVAREMGSSSWNNCGIAPLGSK